MSRPRPKDATPAQGGSSDPCGDETGNDDASPAFVGLGGVHETVPVELAELTEWGRRAKEKAITVVMLDGTIANAVDFWRDGARVCRIVASVSNDGLLNLLRNGIPAINADAVTYVFDSWVTTVPIDLDVDSSDRQAVLDAAEHGGERYECLSTVLHRRDGEYRSVWLRYTHDRQTRTLSWDELHVEPVDHADGNGPARFPNVVAKAFAAEPWHVRMAQLLPALGVDVDELGPLQPRIDATWCLFAAAHGCTVLIGAKGKPLPAKFMEGAS